MTGKHSSDTEVCVCVCVLHKHYLPVVTSLSLRCSVNLICSDGPAHPAAPGPTVQTSPTLQPPTSLLLLCSDTCLHLTQASAEAHGQTCSAHTLDFCCPLFLICAAQHKSTKTAASSTGCAERGGGPGVLQRDAHSLLDTTGAAQPTSTFIYSSSSTSLTSSSSSSPPEQSQSWAGAWTAPGASLL